MALLKKGSRLIVVDGMSYRWRVRKKPSYHQAVHEGHLLLAVEHAERAGSVLVVTLPQQHPSSCLNPEIVPVLPSTVAGFVRAALEYGWRPSEAGKTFVLDVRAGA